MGLRTPLETVTMTKVGGNPLFWKNFLNNAAKEALSQIESGLVITMHSKPKKEKSSLLNHSGHKCARKLQQDFEEFVGSQKWYVDRGVPYRRGYLLHGPPGTGKSSLSLLWLGITDTAFALFY
uniref:Mitochondrial chaperone BCS1 n=1 Tax=Ditylenchus dipsaci TaxID=166011 RepID=A0A915DCS1_9BILA